MAATLQRKSSGGINFVIITKIITKDNVPRNYFVIISARMVQEIAANRWYRQAHVPTWNMQLAQHSARWSTSQA